MKYVTYQPRMIHGYRPEEERPSMRDLTISVKATRGKRATVVHLYGEGKLLATGESICHPDDKFDSDVGIELATARALNQLGNRLSKLANATVTQRDNDREQRERAKARKVEEPQGVSFEPVPIHEGYERYTEKGKLRCQGTTRKGTQCEFSTLGPTTDFCAWH